MQAYLQTDQGFADGAPIPRGFVVVCLGGFGFFWVFLSQYQPNS